MISGLRQPGRKCCFTKSSRAEISTPGIFAHGADEIGICRICGCSALRYGVTDIRIFQYIAGNLNHVLPTSPLPLPPPLPPSALCRNSPALFIFISFFFITYRNAHVANCINLP